MITLRYRSVDGYRTTRNYKTLAGAQKYAHEMVGEHPELGRNYAVSTDGIATLRVEGATLAELFPPQTNTETTA